MIDELRLDAEKSLLRTSASHSLCQDVEEPFQVAICWTDWMDACLGIVLSWRVMAGKEPRLQLPRDFNRLGGSHPWR